MQTEFNNFPDIMETRLGDMDPSVELSAGVDGEGDVWIALYDERKSICIEFCTRHGGGRSPTVHAAIKELIKAMKEDNQTTPLTKQ